MLDGELSPRARGLVVGTLGGCSIMQREVCRRLSFRGTTTQARSLLAVVAVVGGCVTAGCGMFGSGFVPGNYTGELTCSIQAEDGPGGTTQDQFTVPVTFTVDADGTMAINEVDVVIGEAVVRSIPTADLAFEITDVVRMPHHLIVTYTPRPTLPGISIDGELIESYHLFAGSIQAAATADLAVTDVSGTISFTVECDGALTVP